MEHVLGLKCLICGKEYRVSEVEYVCPDHGNGGNLDVVYNYARIRSSVAEAGLPSLPGIWRYMPIMPLDQSAQRPPLLVGNTPLYQLPDLAKRSGLKEVHLKDDGRNPTASLKDRASAVVVARALAEKRPIVTTASTGNAAAALSGLSASVGLPAVIFVPASAPVAKVTQLLVYGAHVFLVNGTYDDAFDLCLKTSQHYGWYCRNTGYNPYTVEGKKTVAFEICEQLAAESGRFATPDAIVVSVGDGNIIGGVFKGLKDLLALGWIDHMPRLIGIQAEGSSALVKAWEGNIDPELMTPSPAETIADSISAGLPRDRVRAMKAVRETDGAFLSVTDNEILEAIPALARSSGVFAEPAASAAYAGFWRAVEKGLLGANDKVVILSTGNGLKDINSAQKSVGDAHRINPDLDDVRKIVNEIFPN